ncbi:tripartite tricarboxylate transporter TctB family protein [Pseudothermotoga thermarum]|uniref:DUF1468 domain-containing protein n=1 Tax=Pseudothermotoga thermarum DSM 5069 TaxID=688269 RepID=F7YY51_9THEM|nr:tripartite tricarboxylate transporter TctB family protein [Pseudothermotoga thermarum]AEH50865.1 hypothetical protein Theth_0780 [Pseudothermotoga thermarum DSM 5069]
MRSMKEFFASIGFLITGIAFLRESYRIRILKFGTLLPGDVFPKIFSVALICLSILWLAVSFTKMLKEIKQERKVTNIDLKALLRVITYIVCSIVYVILMDYFGFILATIFLSMVTYLLLKPDFRKIDLFFSAAYSVATTFGIWYVFEKVLKLVLPAGRLF